MVASSDVVVMPACPAGRQAAGKTTSSYPFELAASYLKELKGPYKEVIWFENSGHYPNLEESEKYQDVLINKVLRKALSQ